MLHGIKVNELRGDLKNTFEMLIFFFFNRAVLK